MGPVILPLVFGVVIDETASSGAWDQLWGLTKLAVGSDASPARQSRRGVCLAARSGRPGRGRMRAGRGGGLDAGFARADRARRSAPASGTPIAVDPRVRRLQRRPPGPGGAPGQSLPAGTLGTARTGLVRAPLAADPGLAGHAGHAARGTGRPCRRPTRPSPSRPGSRSSSSRPSPPAKSLTVRRSACNARFRSVLLSFLWRGDSAARRSCGRFGRLRRR